MSDIPQKAGIYFVRLWGEELISVNQNDSNRRDHCILVNSANSKYGKTTNLQTRFNSYRRTFSDSRLRFTVLATTENTDELEQRLHRHFQPHRMRGLTGRLNEWLAGIEPEEALSKAIEICGSANRCFGTQDVMPARIPGQLPQTWKNLMQRHTPNDILTAVDYLERHGMSKEMYQKLHHSPKQIFTQTRRYFTGRTKIQGSNNPIFAARLDFVVRGHIGGKGFIELVRQATELYPYPYK